MDFAEVLDYKTLKLAQDPTSPVCNCKLTSLGVDLRESGWTEALKEKGYKPSQPSVWLIEGTFSFKTTLKGRALCLFIT